LAIAVWLIGSLPQIPTDAAFYEAVLGLRGVLRDRLANQAHDRCGDSWLVPPVTLTGERTRSNEKGGVENTYRPCPKILLI
jgi:hypothetical protein